LTILTVKKLEIMAFDAIVTICLMMC